MSKNKKNKSKNKALILILIVILFGTIGMLTGIVSIVKGNLFTNQSEEVSIVQNFIDNAKDDKDVACESAYKIFATNSGIDIKCKSVFESDYTYKKWFYDDIEVISIANIKLNMYIDEEQDRKEYNEVIVSHKVNDSDTISKTTFYVFELDGKNYFTLEYVQKNWFV